jgi:hypothetical protein
MCSVKVSALVLAMRTVEAIQLVMVKALDLVLAMLLAKVPEKEMETQKVMGFLKESEMGSALEMV